MGKTNGEFELVKDMGAMTMLEMLGFKPVEVVRERSGWDGERFRVVFKYTRTPELKQVLDDYFLFRTQVEPRKFLRTLRSVREIIRNTIA